MPKDSRPRLRPKPYDPSNTSQTRATNVSESSHLRATNVSEPLPTLRQRTPDNKEVSKQQKDATEVEQSNARAQQLRTPEKKQNQSPTSNRQKSVVTKKVFSGTDVDSEEDPESMLDDKTQQEEKGDEENTTPPPKEVEIPTPPVQLTFQFDEVDLSNQRSSGEFLISPEDPTNMAVDVEEKEEEEEEESNKKLPSYFTRNEKQAIRNLSKKNPSLRKIKRLTKLANNIKRSTMCYYKGKSPRETRTMFSVYTDSELGITESSTKLVYGYRHDTAIIGDSLDINFMIKQMASGKGERKLKDMVQQALPILKEQLFRHDFPNVHPMSAICNIGQDKLPAVVHSKQFSADFYFKVDDTRAHITKEFDKIELKIQTLFKDSVIFLSNAAVKPRDFENLLVLPRYKKMFPIVAMLLKHFKNHFGVTLRLGDKDRRDYRLNMILYIIIGIAAIESAWCAYLKTDPPNGQLAYSKRINQQVSFKKLACVLLVEDWATDNWSNIREWVVKEIEWILKGHCQINTLWHNPSKQQQKKKKKPNK